MSGGGEKEEDEDQKNKSTMEIMTMINIKCNSYFFIFHFSNKINVFTTCKICE